MLACATMRLPETAKDILAGTSGGVAQVLVGQYVLPLTQAF